jgi:hypothetical protein
MRWKRRRKRRTRKGETMNSKGYFIEVYAHNELIERWMRTTEEDARAKFHELAPSMSDVVSGCRVQVVELPGWHVIAKVG